MTYYRKIIQIAAKDSPNVRLAEAEIRAGKTPSGKILIPGVITYDEYKKRRKLWDKQMQCVSLDGEFYEGEEIKLFPPDWINYSISIWKPNEYAKAKAMGVDPAEGGDNTTYCIGSERKLIQLFSEKTPDTTLIPDRVIALMKLHNIPPELVFFDEGGGGKEHVDRLRRNGYHVNGLFFGEAATEPRVIQRQWKSRQEKLGITETRLAFKNRRAELYHKASMRCNPAYGGYAMPPEVVGSQYKELYRQLRVMPKLIDGEGKFYLPPKNPRPNSKETSIRDMLGCSPDEADAFVLMHWGLEKNERTIIL